ncbi:hypothetical protein [Motiliproteus sediminis]|uniref:hypothetical protein n=1 Tax=Motiliproteus sediminis TaxID=1468178 RepID=UPI001AEF80A8|nr:hypothetical protein [Motiliproteus sediminis]
MPFTPFHLGPGIAIKALLQGSFSLMVFGWAQILMDIQPLLVMLTREGHLHGFSHTILGALLIGLLAALSGKVLAELGLRLLGYQRLHPITIRWPVALLSALIGTFSHVSLDSIMHADVEPFYLFNLDNPMLGWISVSVLHWLCVGSGVIGGLVYLVVARELRR